MFKIGISDVSSQSKKETYFWQADLRYEKETKYDNILNYDRRFFKPTYL